jgi:5-methylcytosine-specific restriction protein A
MNYWIIPANPNRYKLADVLRDMECVDWRQHNNFEIGDIVFIYNSKPDSQILYKMEVIAVNLTGNETTADRQYWINPSEYDTSMMHNRFFRMRILVKNNTDKLTLHDLYEHGLKGAPQGALKVKEPLLSYIHTVL